MPDRGCDIVVVGASAGGVEALKRFARAAPADFAAPILVVLHVPSSGFSVLPAILARAGPLPAISVGLYCIKEAGGAALVQDPGDALYPAMPANAIAYVQPDYVLPVEQLVDTLVRLTATAAGRPGKEVVPTPDAAPDPSAEDAQPGVLAPFSCPDCGGTLWETQEGEVISYRCRVGHAYTMNSLVDRHVDTLERTLWAACRALEERAAMSRRVARRLADRGRGESSARFERQARISARQATELKALLDSLEAAPDLGLEAAG